MIVVTCGALASSIWMGLINAILMIRMGVIYGVQASPIREGLCVLMVMTNLDMHICTIQATPIWEGLRVQVRQMATFM